jgi:hypothetical protein
MTEAEFSAHANAVAKSLGADRALVEVFNFGRWLGIRLERGQAAFALAVGADSMARLSKPGALVDFFRAHYGAVLGAQEAP